MRALFLALLLPSCTLALDPDDLMGGGDGGITTPDPIPARGVCESLAEAYCDAEARCCGAPDPSRRERCASWIASRCAGWVALADDARTAYDGALARAVLDEALARIDACDPSLVPFLSSVEGLPAALEGTVEPGEACASGAEPATVALHACREQHACVRIAPSRWNCLAPMARGGTCRLDRDCAEGLFCDTDAPGEVDGTCEPKRPEGGECARAAECSSALCVDGDCVALTQTNAYCAFDGRAP